MLLEKRPLSLEEIEAQAALELPERELMQITQVNQLNQTANAGVLALNLSLLQANACIGCVGSIQVGG